MPRCGSQVVLCDLPVRFDTYTGCTHACSYCFVKRKADISEVDLGETAASLRRWIAGHRTAETAWVDWPLPLHWGGVSDPFQPAERRFGRSLECLKVLAETGYPVVFSTKATLPAEEPYRTLIARGNVAVQVSMTAPAYDRIEPGAATFEERLRAVERLSTAARRVVVRCQPYVPAALKGVLAALPRYAEAGAHGITVEALKRTTAAPGLVRVGGEFLLPADVLARDFLEIRDAAHAAGLAFYAAENRLRKLGDSPTCCGVAGLAGFSPNLANLNRYPAIPYRPHMDEARTGYWLKTCSQTTAAGKFTQTATYRQALEMAARTPFFRKMMALDAEGAAR